MPARLQEHYTKTVRDALVKEFSYKNAFEVPKLDKIRAAIGFQPKHNLEQIIRSVIALRGWRARASGRDGRGRPPCRRRPPGPATPP